MTATEISCDIVLREISNYIEHEMDELLWQQIREHLEDCLHCTAIHDGARNVIRLVSDGRVLELPSGFSERLYRRMNQAQAIARPRTNTPQN